MIDYITPLVLGGIAIAPHSGPIRQRYQAFGGSSEIRLASGRGIKQTHWRKTATTVSATGYLDPALDLLDYSRPLELLCVTPRWLPGTGLVYQLPPAAQRRSDVAPWAIALQGEHWVDTSLTLEGDQATLAAIPHARGYRVGWLPRLIVLTDGVIYDKDQGSDLVSWSLEAREA